MIKQTHSKPKFKLVCRPGRTVIKAALLGVLVLSTAALVAIHASVSANEQRSQALKQQALALAQENQKLEQYLESKGTHQGIAQVAQNEQGMVAPDTVIYDFG